MPRSTWLRTVERQSFHCLEDCKPYPRSVHDQWYGFLLGACSFLSIHFRLKLILFRLENCWKSKNNKEKTKNRMSVASITRTLKFIFLQFFDSVPFSYTTSFWFCFCVSPGSEKIETFHPTDRKDWNIQFWVLHLCVEGSQPITTPGDVQCLKNGGLLESTRGKLKSRNVSDQLRYDSSIGSGDVLMLGSGLLS